MANVLSIEKREQVLLLARLGWSLRRIQKATGVRRETAKGYLQTAGIAVRGPRQRRLAAAPSSPPAPVAEPNPASEVTADPGVGPVSDGTPRSHCAGHRDVIAAAVDLGRNGKSIWQELVDRYGFAGSYESVKRFIRTLRPTSAAIAHPRIETGPGEEAQVDYGTGPLVLHPDTGKYRRTRLFVMTLGCSRKSIALLCWKSSSQIWCELHQEAFRRLGGSCRTIVLDNLKEGVLAPDTYDPTLNPLYAEMLAHHGAVALPARIRHPDRKGKVESAIGYVQDTALKGHWFESIEAAQRHLDDWISRWADTRIHGTTKQQVAAMFERERPSLLPLPAEPFRRYEFGVRTVHTDGTVEVAKAYYAAPPGMIGRRLQVRWDERFVRILDPKTGQALREHLRQVPGRYRVEAQDRSPKTPPQIEQLLERARRAGKHIGELCLHLEQRLQQHGAREILGVLSLAKRHGFPVIDDCCRIALEGRAATYRMVRKLADRPRPGGPPLRQVDDLIRRLSDYRDFIDRKTELNHESERTRSLTSQTPPVGHG